MKKCETVWKSKQALSLHMPELMTLDPQSPTTGQPTKTAARPVPRLYQFAPTPRAREIDFRLEGNFIFRYEISNNTIDDTTTRAGFQCPGESGEVPLRVTGEFMTSNTIMEKERAFYDFYQKIESKGNYIDDDATKFAASSAGYTYAHCTNPMVMGAAEGMRSAVGEKTSWGMIVRRIENLCPGGALFTLVDALFPLTMQ